MADRYHAEVMQGLHELQQSTSVLVANTLADAHRRSADTSLAYDVQAFAREAKGGLTVATANVIRLRTLLTPVLEEKVDGDAGAAKPELAKETRTEVTDLLDVLEKRLVTMAGLVTLTTLDPSLHHEPDQQLDRFRENQLAHVATQQLGIYRPIADQMTPRRLAMPVFDPSDPPLFLGSMTRVGCQGCMSRWKAIFGTKCAVKGQVI